MDKKQEFLKKILATFKIEAEENINTISADLIELEKGCTDERKEEILEVIYRAAHSLKGASRAVNLTEIERICHAFEDVMSTIRCGNIQFSQQIFDLLNQTVDLLSEALFARDGIVSPELSEKIADHIENLTLAEAGLEIDLGEKPAPKKQVHKKALEPVISSSQKSTDKKSTSAKLEFTKKSGYETIRISTRKLDNLLVQAEEMLSLKLNAKQRTENLNSTTKKLRIWNEEISSVLESTVKLKQLLNKKEKSKTLSNGEKEIEKIIQFHNWTHSYIKEIESEIRDLRNHSQQEEYSLGAKIEILLNDVKELITVPFATLLNGFPKMIRDICKDLGKKIDFVVEGDAIEIDRRILENLKSPLTHILRNSIDYGIEKPEDRLKHHKSEVGKITLKIEQQENNTIEILISDDGAGLDRKKLKKLYIENENIAVSNIDKINEADYLNYIFRSGISTSDIITDLSGRGLGLAIVQEAIEQFKGTISVESIEGKSTSFHIVLPSSIVTSRGVLIESSARQFIVPTGKIKRVVRLHKKEIKTIGNRSTISFDGEVIPVADLSRILEISSKSIASEFIQIIVLDHKNKYFGLIIDHVIGEQEILVKNFNKQLTRVRNISSVSILGSGKVVPILNISDLFNTLSKNRSQVFTSVKDVVPDKVRQRSILVVEDSITSRTLMKNILEASGNLVTTAIDGVDGFTKLKEGTYDAVISDVEMPRMNGFDLTAKIRADKECSTIPVVLVTSLAKREHKERGIDVGANAYIVKSSFDQSDLLEILERLI